MVFRLVKVYLWNNNHIVHESYVILRHITFAHTAFIINKAFYSPWKEPLRLRISMKCAYRTQDIKIFHKFSPSKIYRLELKDIFLFSS